MKLFHNHDQKEIKFFFFVIYLDFCVFLGDGAITEDEFVSGCKSDGSFLKVKITFCQFKFKRPQMEENLKNSLLPPGLAHYVLKPKERFEVCHQRFSPPGDGRPLPGLSMECKPLIEKHL